MSSSHLARLALAGPNRRVQSRAAEGNLSDGKRKGQRRGLTCAFVCALGLVIIHTNVNENWCCEHLQGLHTHVEAGYSSALAIGDYVVTLADNVLSPGSSKWSLKPRRSDGKDMGFSYSVSGSAALNHNVPRVSGLAGPCAFPLIRHVWSSDHVLGAKNDNQTNVQERRVLNISPRSHCSTPLHCPAAYINAE